MYSVDLRNHGQSGHAPTMTYEAMAADVQAFMNDMHLSPGILVGHSLGGKVAMETALRFPEIVDKLVVVDVSPVPYDRQMRQANHVLTALAALPLATVANRREADRWLADSVPDASIRNFVLQNLVFSKDEPSMWRINMPALLDSMEVLGGFPYHTEPFKEPTLFIRGSCSNFISTEHYTEIDRLFPSHKLIPLDAGHWVHAENPKEFVATLTNFIKPQL